MENNISNEVLKRVDTVGEKIETAINILAEKIGVGADHFWPIFVRQQFIDGLTTLIVWIVPSIVGLSLTFIFFKLHNAKKNGGDRNIYYDDEWFFTAIVTGAISALISVIMLSSALDSIPQMLNPEYYALKEVMNILNR